MLVDGNFVDSNELEKCYATPHEHNLEKAKSVSAVFEPFWKMNDQTLRQQLKYIELDTSEFLFLAALIFWDSGHDTISPDCIDLCQKMRTKVFHELNEYEKQKTKNEDYGLRVGEIVIVLQAIQKSMEIMKDLRHVSILYNVQEMHRKFYEIMNC